MKALDFPKIRDAFLGSHTEDLNILGVYVGFSYLGKLLNEAYVYKVIQGYSRNVLDLKYSAGLKRSI